MAEAPTVSRIIGGTLSIRLDLSAEVVQRVALEMRLVKRVDPDNKRGRDSFASLKIKNS